MRRLAIAAAVVAAKGGGRGVLAPRPEDEEEEEEEDSSERMEGLSATNGSNRYRFRAVAVWVEAVCRHRFQSRMRTKIFEL